MIRVLVSLNKGIDADTDPWLAQVVYDDGSRDLNVRTSVVSVSVEAALAKLGTHLAERVEDLAAERNILRDAIKRLASMEGFKAIGWVSNDKSDLAHEIQARVDYASEKLTEAIQAGRGA